MRSPRSKGWRVLALALSALALAGCPPRQGDEEPVVLETEDVGPSLDEDLDLSSDRKAAPRTQSAGKLPPGFPEGLPVYKPSTISDVGAGERGDFVQFMSQDDAGAIRAWYSSALARAGWTVETGPGGTLVASLGGRKARISIEASHPVTFVRVEF